MTGQPDLAQRRIRAVRIQLEDRLFKRCPQPFGRKRRGIPGGVGKSPELETFTERRITLQIIDQVGPPTRAGARAMNKDHRNLAAPIWLKTNQLGCGPIEQAAVEKAG